MGQQLAIPTGFSNSNQGFQYPAWYNPRFAVKPSTVANCKQLLYLISNGDLSVNQRVYNFDRSTTPLQFLYKQLFIRLFIISPMFIRKNISCYDLNQPNLRVLDIVTSGFANDLLNDLVMEGCNRLVSSVSIDEINSNFQSIMQYYNQKYGIDAYLFSDIGTVLLQVFSDCLGEKFIETSSNWADFLSKGLQTLIDLNLTTNEYGSFSLRETMMKLDQPYIEWSEVILSTGYTPMDRQHQWLLIIMNISFPSYVVC